MLLDLFVRYNPSREIFAVGRGGEATRVAGKEFRPYFYIISPKTEIDLPEYAAAESTNMVALVFDEAMGSYRYDPHMYVLKVYTSSPMQVRKIADTLKPPARPAGIVKFDVRASFDLVKSFILDRDPLLEDLDFAEAISLAVKETQDLKVASFDMEVEAEEGEFPQPGKSKILSISYSISRLSESADEDLDELIEDTAIEYGEGDGCDAVERFLKSISGVDIVVGYNSADFDIRFINYCLGKEDRDSGESRFLIYNNKVYPHIDLFLLVKSMRAALGIRSTVAYSLDEVALDLGILKSGTRIYDVERQASPETISKWYRSDRWRFELYSKADSAIALAMASQWIPVVAGISAISKIPLSKIQDLPSAGSIVEYILIRYLENLDPPVVTEWRRASWGFGKVSRERAMKLGLGEEHYMGKVISAGGGVYRNVVVFDFDQLYPTIYTFYQLDPISSVASKEPLHPGAMRIYVRKGSHDMAFYFNPLPGAVSILLSRFYDARKRLKAMAREAVSFAKVADKAVKIIANSAYGALSKDSGNLINEFASAYIFYKSNEILLRAVRAIEGMGLRVVYGDTDSLFIQIPEHVKGELFDQLVQDIVDAVKNAVGEAFSIKFEGLYEYMVIAMRKAGGGESKKSYVLVSDDNIILKGIFYKHELPDILDVVRTEIIRKLLLGVQPEKILDEILSGLSQEEIVRGLTVRKTVELDFISEKGGLKLLNKPQHYVALVYLCSKGLCERHGSRFFFPADLHGNIKILSVRFGAISPRELIIVIGDEIKKVTVKEVSKDDERKGYWISYSEKPLKIEDAVRLLRVCALKALNDLSSILPQIRMSRSLLPSHKSLEQSEEVL
jgi:DNA polymerase elongation subunit (family B)